MNGLPFSDMVQGSKMRKTVTLAVNCFFIYIYIYKQLTAKVTDIYIDIYHNVGRGFGMDPEG